MLTIGEFSNICKVSTKTLRYYAEIGLLAPSERNSENGYRYYTIEQLNKMIMINRLKEYSFSLDEIKEILESEHFMNEKLYTAIRKKKKEIENKIRNANRVLTQLDFDLSNMEQGKSIMAYMEQIDIQLVEVPVMYLLSERKMVLEEEFSEQYRECYRKIFQKITSEGLRMTAPPMVLFHSSEFTSFGLDTEFAVPVKEHAAGVKEFCPGLCLKTVLRGTYSNLSSVYAKHREWMEREKYEYSSALYEVYVSDPYSVKNEQEFITEVYSPVKKKADKLKKRS